MARAIITRTQRTAFWGDDPQYLKEKEGGEGLSEWHLFIPGTCAHKGLGAHQQWSP